MKTLEYKIFITLFFAVFAAVTGIGMVVPLLPIYVNDLGANGIEIGLVLGSFSLSRGLLLPYFGRLSDQSGRKVYIVIGFLLYTIIPIGFIFSKNVESIIIVRFVQGIASAMIMPSIHAYVGEITSEGNEGKIMGIFNMSVFIGLSTGPFIGGIIKDQFGINSALICMGILSFLGLMLSFFFLPQSIEEVNIKKKNHIVKWSTILGDTSFIGLIIIRFSYTTCIGIIWGFLPILAHNEYNLSSSSIGILIMLGVGVSGLIHIPMGWISDKVDRKIMIIIGGFIVIISIYLFALASGFWTLFYFNVLFGIGGGLITPAIMAAAVVRGNKKGAMGTIMALLTMGHSLGMLFGSFLAGLMMNFLNLRYVFYIGSGFMFFGLILFIILTKKHDLNEFSSIKF